MKTHRPSGRMCSVCQDKYKDCSNLDFKIMPKIAQDKDGMIVVKCIQFKVKETKND